MRKTLYFFVLILVVFLFGVLLFLRDYKPQSLISPILKNYKLKMAVNAWYPKESPDHFSDAPQILAEAAFFIETESGQVLYEKNSQNKLPIASLTKIMTAIVALELKDFDDTFLVSSRAAGMEPDKMFLKPGEKLALEELLAGMLLVSANDAAEVLAEEVTESRDAFLQLMNEKALQLGMKDTKFINPSGLQEDPPDGRAGGVEQFSTAYDVAVMSRYLIKKWPKLLDISSQPHIFIEETTTHQSYDLFSGINLLTTYPGVVGLKTGFTPEAGFTLVSVAQREGNEVLGVLLNSPARRDDAKALLDYSFKRLGIE